jgi:hypothetical protein
MDLHIPDIWAGIGIGVVGTIVVIIALALIFG